MNSSYRSHLFPRDSLWKGILAAHTDVSESHAVRSQEAETFTDAQKGRFRDPMLSSTVGPETRCLSS